MFFGEPRFFIRRIPPLAPLAFPQEPCGVPFASPTSRSATFTPESRAACGQPPVCRKRDGGAVRVGCEYLCVSCGRMCSSLAHALHLRRIANALASGDMDRLCPNAKQISAHLAPSPQSWQQCGPDTRKKHGVAMRWPRSLQRWDSWPWVVHT